MPSTGEEILLPEDDLARARSTKYDGVIAAVMLTLVVLAVLAVL